MILSGWAIAGLLAIAAIVTVFDLPGGKGGDDAPRELAVAQPRRTAVSRVEGAARTPTSAARAVATPKATTPAPNPLASLAAACDVLRGSRAWQPNDREWFLANCLGGAGRPSAAGSASVFEPPTGGYVDALPGPTSAPPPTVGVTLPMATPAPAPASQAALAISMAVSWLRNDAPVTYQANPGACSGVSLGGAWVITCNAPLAGCGDQPSCVRTIGLCVTIEPPSVTSARAC